jgi:hypothetical protein
MTPGCHRGFFFVGLSNRLDFFGDRLGDASTLTCAQSIQDEYPSQRGWCEPYGFCFGGQRIVAWFIEIDTDRHGESTTTAS